MNVTEVPLTLGWLRCPRWPWLLQLDTVGIVNSLWMSDSLRSELVSMKAVPATISAPATLAKPIDTTDQTNSLYYNFVDLRQLANRGLLTLPTGFSAWWNSWADVKIPGVILSALLLSMGAPFWYNTLKTLLGLREQIAVKDDAQRVTRQT
jgi:hypothetical protein